jgi:translation initiation factor IF-1
MVKNTTGGTKTKGLARKHIKPDHSSGGSVRLPQNILEQIVYVNKMVGNGMCEVYNNDDVRLIAHIRNKFKGRNQRANNITANSYILIGLRDWETPYKNCDVIFVYDDIHFNTIRNLTHLPILNIIKRHNNDDYDKHKPHDNHNHNHNDNILFNHLPEPQPQPQPHTTTIHTPTTIHYDDI